MSTNASGFLVLLVNANDGRQPEVLPAANLESRSNGMEGVLLPRHPASLEAHPLRTLQAGQLGGGFNGQTKLFPAAASGMGQGKIPP